MSFVVDTDTCSAYIKAHPLVWSRFMQHAGRLFVSVVTVAELMIWVNRANAPPKRARDVEDLMKVITPLEVTMEVARKFGETQAALMDGGQQAPELDLLIAATALVQGYSVVTHNTHDYAMIPSLAVVDWLVP